MATTRISNHEKFRAKLGAEIKARRNEKGLSTRQLAEKIDKTQPRIPDTAAGAPSNL